MSEHAQQTAPLLAIEGLEVCFGKHRVLEGLAVQSGPGVIGVCGPNGAGKSTLLRTIAGVIQPLRGQLKVAGFDLQRQPVEARRQIGYLPEHADLYPYLSCREICELVSSLRGAPLDGWREHLDALGIAGLEDVRMGTLSAGQQRKVTLLAALCGSPQVLLLDEPTKALDVSSRAFLDEVIQTWRDAGRLVLLTSHLWTYLRDQCDRFLYLTPGASRLVEAFEELPEAQQAT